MELPAGSFRDPLEERNEEKSIVVVRVDAYPVVPAARDVVVAGSLITKRARHVPDRTGAAGAKGRRDSDETVSAFVATARARHGAWLV
jgi:hypothetical protein